MQVHANDANDANIYNINNNNIYTKRKNIKKEKDPSPGFSKFWDAWPPHSRKCDKPKCFSKWQALGCEEITETIINHVEDMKFSEQWQDDNGQYIPAPLVYLSRRQWEAPVPPQPQERKNGSTANTVGGAVYHASDSDTSKHGF